MFTAGSPERTRPSTVLATAGVNAAPPPATADNCPRSSAGEERFSKYPSAPAAIASTIFLGGWWIPLYHPGGVWGDLFGFGVLFVKTMLVSFLIFWVRFTYPRFREDQLQAFAWKILIPIALANLVVTALFKVVVH